MLGITIVEDLGSDPDLKESLTQCWIDVSNSGGAVGFPFPPVDPVEVANAVDELAGEVRDGGVVVFVASVDGVFAGWVVLRFNRSRLTSHWALVERLQSDPRTRGYGVGGALLNALTEHAAGLGLDHLQLEARGGVGLEAFYERQGWFEIGRHPGCLRLGDGDIKDRVLMVLKLDVLS